MNDIATWLRATFPGTEPVRHQRFFVDGGAGYVSIGVWVGTCELHINSIVSHQPNRGHCKTFVQHLLRAYAHMPEPPSKLVFNTVCSPALRHILETAPLPRYVHLDEAEPFSPENITFSLHKRRIKN